MKFEELTRQEQLDIFAEAGVIQHIMRMETPRCRPASLKGEEPPSTYHSAVFTNKAAAVKFLTYVTAILYPEPQ